MDSQAAAHSAHKRLHFYEPCNSSAKIACMWRPAVVLLYSAAGPLCEEAGRQLQPLGTQLTRLSLQGAHAPSATMGAAKVGWLRTVLQIL